MLNKDILLSICIPTNGVIEWVFPVLDSIYRQDVDESLYEVVITDNGNNQNFFELMSNYSNNHSNLRYIKTEAFEFLNEIEAYKAANGVFIKFINHRTLFLDGTLNYFLKFVETYKSSKPVVYFANGVLNFKGTKVFTDFDQYVCGLSYWSSWSTGMGFWKEDFERLDKGKAFNTLFPHTDILFGEKTKNQYIIDNRVLLEEIPAGKIPKGRYNLFNAFAVEYPAIILDLYRNNNISYKSFLYLKHENLKFIAKLYWDYIIRKKKCSYDLSGYSHLIGVFYSKFSIYNMIFKLTLKKLFCRK